MQGDSASVDFNGADAFEIPALSDGHFSDFEQGFKSSAFQLYTDSGFGLT